MEEYVWISKLVNNPVFTSQAHPVLYRMAEDYDVRVTISGPEDTSHEQYLHALNDAVKKRVAGIMLVGWQNKDVISAINDAVEIGIPIMTVDSDIQGSNRLAYVGTDWFRMGGAMADEIATRISGRGKVLMIGKSDKGNNQIGFRGFKYRMAAYSNVEIIGLEDDSDTGPEHATEIVSKYLRRYPDLAGVVAFDSNGGPGAAIAISAAGKSDKIKIVCVETESANLEYLRSGAIDSLFAQKREAFTNLAFQMLYSFNHGSAATGYRPGLINIPGNIDTGYVVVTRNNLETFEAEYGHEDAYKRHDLSQRLGLVSGVLENSSEIALAGDNEGRIVYANKTAIRLLGLKDKKLDESSIENMFTLTRLQKEKLKQCTSEGKAARFESSIQAGDKDRIPYQISISPLYADKLIRGVVLIATDISQLKKVRHELRESEEQLNLLSAIARQSTEGIALSNMDGRLEFVNNAFAQMHGHSPQELLGKDISVFYTPEQMPSVEKANEQIVRTGEFVGEIWHVRKDGTVFPAMMHNTLLRDKNNKPIGIIGMMRDITQQKQTKEALAVSEERFRRLADAAEEGIAIHENGVIIDANDALGKMIGYEVDELIGIHSSLLVPAESWEIVKKNMLAGYEKPYECIVNRKDGSSFPCQFVAKSYEYQGRKLRVAVVRDLTDRKKAENALRQSEERFRTLFETAQDAIFLKDSQLRYLAVNSSMAEMLGILPDQFIGKKYADLWGDDQSEYNENLEKKVLKGEIVGEESVKMVKGEPRTYHIVTVPMQDPDGKITGLCGIARDITENRRLQAYAERAQRLEVAGRIAGQVAHDFNNLLGPLVAYPGLIRDELSEDHPVIEFLDDIENAAQQMADINQQLLTLGRRGYYNLEPLNVNSIIKQVVDRHQPTKNINVNTDLEEDLMNFNGGSAQIYRVLSNLVINAIDAMTDEGRLTIKSENFYVNEELGTFSRIPRGEYVKLTVSDTGMGIPDRIMPNIFDPFFTTKTANKKRGSGLGLSVVHAVVEDHEGYIDIESEPGKGTTFYLYFPITRDTVAEIEDESIKGGNESILVVDDDPVQREVTSRLLQKIGYDIHTVDGGEAAIDYLNQNKSDLLVLDMVMHPGIDGVETYKLALQINPDQKAIIVSGFAESDRVKIAAEHGAGEFIRKPLTLKSIACAVRKELDEKVKKPAGK